MDGNNQVTEHALQPDLCLSSTVLLIYTFFCPIWLCVMYTHAYVLYAHKEAYIYLTDDHSQLSNIFYIESKNMDMHSW